MGRVTAWDRNLLRGYGEMNPYTIDNHEIDYL